jgi:serine/threonine-protein kinase OSR1/STK39
VITEVQALKRYDHPHVLPLYCSFVHERELWLVMPFIQCGSLQRLIHERHPAGVTNEAVIVAIMRGVLSALAYVHAHGGIHRDVKAGNVLIDADGHPWLSDFGAAAIEQPQQRTTFVGTLCWMAPEVIEQGEEGYDSSADIWSFGITLLELAYGRAPLAHFPPLKVMCMTLQDAPPALDDPRFSAEMRDVVTCCLQRDPHARHTASQLLQHAFFKRKTDNGMILKEFKPNEQGAPQPQP